MWSTGILRRTVGTRVLAVALSAALLQLGAGVVASPASAVDPVIYTPEVWRGWVAAEQKWVLTGGTQGTYQERNWWVDGSRTSTAVQFRADVHNYGASFVSTQCGSQETEVNGGVAQGSGDSQINPSSNLASDAYGHPNDFPADPRTPGMILNGYNLEPAVQLTGTFKPAPCPNSEEGLSASGGAQVAMMNGYRVGVPVDIDGTLPMRLSGEYTTTENNGEATRVIRVCMSRSTVDSDNDGLPDDVDLAPLVPGELIDLGSPTGVPSQPILPTLPGVSQGLTGLPTCPSATGGSDEVMAVDDSTRRQTNADGLQVNINVLANDKGQGLRLQSVDPISQIGGPPTRVTLRPLPSTGGSVVVGIPSAKANGGKPVLGTFQFQYRMRGPSGQSDTGTVTFTLFDCAKLTTEEHFFADGASLTWKPRWCFDGSKISDINLDTVDTDTSTRFNILFAAFGGSMQWSHPIQATLAGTGWKLTGGPNRLPRHQLCFSVPGKKVLKAMGKAALSELFTLVFLEPMPDNRKRAIDQLLRAADELSPKPCWTLGQVDVKVFPTPAGAVIVSYSHERSSLVAKYTFKIRYTSGGKRPRDYKDKGGFDSPKKLKRSVVWNCAPYDAKCRPVFTGQGQR